MLEKVSEQKCFEMKMMEETLRKKLKNSFFPPSMLLQDNDRKILQMDAFQTTSNHLCINKKNQYFIRTTFKIQLFVHHLKSGICTFTPIWESMLTKVKTKTTSPTLLVFLPTQPSTNIFLNLIKQSGIQPESWSTLPNSYNIALSSTNSHEGHHSFSELLHDLKQTAPHCKTWLQCTCMANSHTECISFVQKPSLSWFYHWPDCTGLLMLIMSLRPTAVPAFHLKPYRVFMRPELSKMMSQTGGKLNRRVRRSHHFLC